MRHRMLDNLPAKPPTEVNTATRLLHQFASRKTSLFLFALLALSLMPFTFYKTLPPFFSPLIQTELLLLAANLALCTWRRWKRLRTGVLLLHLGFLLVLTGGLIGTAGFTATVNIYENDATNTAFRWDRGKDTDLGFSLRIKKIQRQYYPIPVQIGILKNNIKAQLIEGTTGDSFLYDGFEIAIDSLDIPAKNLQLHISLPNDKPVIFNTAGSNTLPTGFPLAFQLVAYKTPHLKRLWSEIEIIKERTVLASGITEVNHPFQWNGMRFYNTATGTGAKGPFAGIQIVRDPGVPLVYLGFGLMTGGGLLLVRRQKRGGTA